MYLATEFLSNYFLTDDLIRIIAKEDTLEGYLYAYLDSWVDRSIMTHNESDLTVDHIDPYQIEEMPVILLPEDERRGIHDDVQDAYRGREEFLRQNKTTVEQTGDVIEALGKNRDDDLESLIS